MTLDEARSRHLEALHAVVSAACAVAYNDLLRPSFEADELRRALDAETAASKAVTRAAAAEQKQAAQLRLVEVSA